MRYADEFGCGKMYKCKDCPEGKRDTLLCIHCKKHHDKTHKNFEEVEEVENQECGCDCFNNRAKILSKKERTYYQTDEDVGALLAR